MGLTYLLHLPNQAPMLRNPSQIAASAIPTVMQTASKTCAERLAHCPNGTLLVQHEREDASIRSWISSSDGMSVHR